MEKKKLNKQEFLELYGEAKVVFSSYYKYAFLFKGEVNGKSILLSVGGHADDIYRLDVSAGKEYAIKDLDMNYAEVQEGDITVAELSNGWFF